MKIKVGQNTWVLATCCSMLFFIAVINKGNIKQFDRWQDQDHCENKRLLGPLSDDDPDVLTTLREHYLIPPSTLPYNLSDPMVKGFNTFSWPFIHHYITYFFRDQPPGFFMEAGALNGEYISNTLWLERRRHWTGILLEPDRNTFMHLIWKRRKVWASNTCLSTTEYPKEGLFATHVNVPDEQPNPWLHRANTFEISKQIAKTFDFSTWSRRILYNNNQCFPLTSYLLALNITTLDFLSLDTQGHEWDILKTVFERNHIKVRALVVEHYKSGNRLEFDSLFVKYMRNVGYHFVDCDDEPNYFFVLKGDKTLMDKVRQYEDRGLKKYCNVTFTLEV